MYELYYYHPLYNADTNGWYLLTKLLPSSYISTFCIVIVCDQFPEFTFPSLHRNEIQSIWENKSIQETYQRRNEFTLPDCCKYFLSQISRVSDPHFLPDVNDILQVRVKTTGIVEYKFQDEGKEIIMVLNRKYLDSCSFDIFTLADWCWWSKEWKKKMDPLFWGQRWQKIWP